MPRRDTPPADTPPRVPARAAGRSAEQPHDNGDGTVTVTVDDSSSLLAPDGAPDSHPETFTAGTQPSTLSPQYTKPHSSDSETSDTNASDTSTTPGDATPASDTSDTSRSRRHRRHEASAAEDTVTVTDHPEDGLLATKWDPQTVTADLPARAGAAPPQPHVSARRRENGRGMIYHALFPFY